jgi:hypothetical protein
LRKLGGFEGVSKEYLHREKDARFPRQPVIKTKQGKAESISEWIQIIQLLGFKFRESALLNCRMDERAGILNLSDKLRNICFIQELYSDRIQTIVRSRNSENFDEIAETSLEEESAILSKNERSRGDTGTQVKCSNCGKVGHTSHKCYIKKDHRVNQARLDKPGTSREVICFRCNTKGHFARDCRKAGDRCTRRDNRKEKQGNENRLMENSRPSVNTVQ